MMTNMHNDRCVTVRCPHNSGHIVYHKDGSSSLRTLHQVKLTINLGIFSFFTCKSKNLLVYGLISLPHTHFGFVMRLISAVGAYKLQN